ncbi:hypothetical protein BFG52_03190 [Acinetobacter larvae]|uniref:Core-binding (CB) domain-containing protein n=2 Tax=Acinetobacter larvae TaxID=1789224 RepID=A0A1B2LWZ4_9GAMM|nr:hypothetical protein BFG52_03190 [Acinetobacter larvae]
MAKHTEITAAEARTKAEVLLAQIASGEDPRKPKSTRRDIPMLLQAYNEYIEEKNLKKSSINSYRKQMYGYLVTYHKWRLDQFTRQDIVDIFKEISKGSKAQANSTMRMQRWLRCFEQLKVFL